MPLMKELMEGVIIKPLRGGDAEVGSAFVSIGELAAPHRIAYGKAAKMRSTKMAR